MAIKTDNTLWGFGSNNLGQLALPVVVNSLQRVPKQLASDVLTAAAGQFFSTIVSTDGTVQSFGSLSTARLGLGYTIEASAPQAVLTGGQTAITHGDHTLVQMRDGSIWGWGSNSYGELGNANPANQITPKRTTLVFSKLAAAYGQSVGIAADTSLWVWGVDKNGNAVSTPAAFAGAGWAVVSPSSSGTAYGVKTDGTLWKWANGLFETPAQIGSGFVTVSASSYADYALAIKSDASLWAVGKNNNGQLGDGTTTNRDSPVLIGSGFTKVSASSDASYGIKTDGTFWAWGRNTYGQLGLGNTTQVLIPTRVPNMSNVTEVAAGGNPFVVVLKSDSAVWAWGLNNSGQLAQGDFTSRSSPALVGTGFANIAAGDDHAIAIKTDGTVFGWGQNREGQVGNGIDVAITSPQQVSFGSLPGATASISVKNSGPAANIKLVGGVIPKAGDVGTLVNTYVVVLVPGVGILVSDGGNFVPYTMQANLPVHQRVAAANILNVAVLPGAFDARVLPSGTQVFVGYGATAAELLNSAQYALIYTAP